jgi:cytochrome c553
MGPLVSALSPQDIEDLASYYAAQRPTYGNVPPNYLTQGQLLFRGGILSRGIPACAACHNPQGLGNAEGRIPALAGQHPEYIVQQLQAYQSGQRSSDVNHIMRDIARRLNDADRQAVANYVSGLH